MRALSLICYVRFHTFIIRIIHEIIDWVRTFGRRTSVSDYALICRLIFGWGIIYAIASTIAAALEGAAESKPMANIMSKSITLVIGC